MIATLCFLLYSHVSSFSSSLLELLLYGRLIDVYKVDLSMDIFTTTEKTALVKSLISSNIRQTGKVNNAFKNYKYVLAF